MAERVHDRDGGDVAQAVGESSSEATESFKSYWHAPALALYPAWTLSLIFFAYSSGGLIMDISVAFGGVGIVCGVSTLGTYFVESQRLDATSSDWVPRWGLYVIASFVLSAAIVAPAYLYQRHRHIGLGTTIKDKQPDSREEW